MREEWVLIGSAVAHAGFLIWALLAQSDWLTPIITFAFFALIYFGKGFLRMGTEELLVTNIPLLLQNLGAVSGLYDINRGLIGYDWVMHFVSAAAAAYIIYSIHVKKARFDERRRRRVIAMHTFLVVSAVLFFGVAIEIIEFGGYVVGGEGERFLDGPGNPDFIHGFTDGHYGDTGIDLINDVLGATAGALLFVWLRYGTIQERRMQERSQD